MSEKISPFKTAEGQAQYFAAYDAALDLWPVSHESCMVTTPYGKTHVISCGTQNANPLVLLHGGRDDMRFSVGCGHHVRFMGDRPEV